MGGGLYCSHRPSVLRLFKLEDPKLPLPVDLLSYLGYYAYSRTGTLYATGKEAASTGTPTPTIIYFRGPYPYPYILKGKG